MLQKIFEAVFFVTEGRNYIKARAGNTVCVISLSAP
jgi:hypothetical protein